MSFRMQLSKSQVQDARASLLRHWMRSSKLGTTPFETPVSKKLMMQYISWMIAESQRPLCESDECRRALYSLVTHPVLFRSLSNIALLFIREPSDKLRFVKTLLAFRTCVLEPAFLMTLVDLLNHPDGSVVA